MDILPDDSRICKIKNGIVMVYKDDDAVEREQPEPLKYPDVKEFVADRNVLLAICSHGPM